MKGRWTLMLAAFLIVTLVVPHIAFAQTANAADVKISLKGTSSFPTAKGTAKYRDRNGEQEFQVEVENVRLPRGTKLNVIVDGNKVGSLRINRFGAGRLNLNSDRGDKVPAIHSGSTVKVQTIGGTAVVTGIFP